MSGGEATRRRRGAEDEEGREASWGWACGEELRMRRGERPAGAGHVERRGRPRQML